MRAVDATEALNRLSELLDSVEAGEEIVITRRGRPAAKLIRANAEERSREPADTALERLAALRERLRRERVVFTSEELLALRDSGRR